MKIHRFYVNEMHNKYGPIALGASVWIHDEKLLNQWLRVLRYKVGDSLVLFNDAEERLYKIAAIEYPHSVHLTLITEMERVIPRRRLILLWSVLKKDKNDWVLQKCTELGVREFVPVIASRSEKTSVNIDRARKIVIEAAEQCGRGDIPIVREPVLLHEAIEEYKERKIMVCDLGGDMQMPEPGTDDIVILVGPEGGWTEQELQQFADAQIRTFGISEFTLRAETASVAVATVLLR